MLKSIQRIKGLGVFADYAPPAGTIEFGVKNLIYGWNYSGKTTLSRLVAMLEAKRLNPELPQCSFTISTDAGNVTEANFQSTSHIVRVFNSDFVADNLNFAGSHFKPILLLGSESEAAQKEIERCEANFEFFSLLRELNPQGSNAALYLVKRVGPKTSSLSNMPESMHRYASEYHFLFHVLDDFHKSADKTDLKVLMLLPNAVRRFVELYTYSKYPDKRSSAVDSRAERVFGGEKSKRILKTLHYFSHANNIERMSENNDLMCDIEGAVDDLMSHLQASDPGHLAALRAAVA